MSAAAWAPVPQIAGKELESLGSVEEVMLKTWNGGKPTPEFNNAAQVRAGGASATAAVVGAATPHGFEAAGAGPHLSAGRLSCKGSLAPAPLRAQPRCPHMPRAVPRPPQVVNHTFFWESMSPNGGGKPSGKVAEAIERDLGGYDKFVEAFKTAGEPPAHGPLPGRHPHPSPAHCAPPLSCLCPLWEPTKAAHFAGVASAKCL